MDRNDVVIIETPKNVAKHRRRLSDLGRNIIVTFIVEAIAKLEMFAIIVIEGHTVNDSILLSMRVLSDEIRRSIDAQIRLPINNTKTLISLWNQASHFKCE